MQFSAEFEDGVQFYTRLEQTEYCYQILHHKNDERVPILLKHARHILDYRADQLTPEHHALYLNNFQGVVKSSR